MNSTSPVQISFALAEYEGKKKITRREILLGKMEQVVRMPENSTHNGRYDCLILAIAMQSNLDGPVSE